jgi:hypothetical protein
LIRWFLRCGRQGRRLTSHWGVARLAGQTRAQCTRSAASHGVCIQNSHGGQLVHIWLTGLLPARAWSHPSRGGWRRLWHGVHPEPQSTTPPPLHTHTHTHTHPNPKTLDSKPGDQVHPGNDRNIQLQMMIGLNASVDHDTMVQRVVEALRKDHKAAVLGCPEYFEQIQWRMDAGAQRAYRMRGIGGYSAEQSARGRISSLELPVLYSFYQTVGRDVFKRLGDAVRQQFQSLD